MRKREPGDDDDEVLDEDGDLIQLGELFARWDREEEERRARSKRRIDDIING